MSEKELSPNDIVRLEISDLVYPGRGLARLDGRVVFVPSALPGETVSARVIRLRKNYAEAELVELEKASPERRLHLRRLAISRVRDKNAVATLFNERVSEFLNRPGGYTRIYKLGNRIGDAAEMAVIQLIPANDEGYTKRRASRKGSSQTAAPERQAEPEVRAELTEAAAETTEPEEAKTESSDTDSSESESSPEKKASE